MKRIIAMALLFSVTASCQKDKGKEFAGNYLVQLAIHPGEHSYLVPSSDTTTLWISSGVQLNPGNFQPSEKINTAFHLRGMTTACYLRMVAQSFSSLSLHP